MRRDRMARAARRLTRGGIEATCPNCGARLRLSLHHDSKTSPLVVLEGRRAKALVANAFPLPAGPLEDGGTCPGLTAACVNCYAAGLETWARPFGAMASRNLETLEHLYRCGGRRAVEAALLEVVERSAVEQRLEGVEAPSFRWMSDGDLFAPWFARAVQRVIEATPDVDHWLYTRSTALVRYVATGAPNARIYISTDRYNLERAVDCARRYGLPVALLAVDDVDAAALWGRVVARWSGVAPLRACPATSTYVDSSGFPAHVVGPDGRRSSLVEGGPAVGACIACGLCLPGGLDASVLFTVHGGHARADSRGRLGAAVEIRRRRALEVEAVTS